MFFTNLYLLFVSICQYIQFIVYLQSSLFTGSARSVFEIIVRNLLVVDSCCERSPWKDFMTDFIAWISSVTMCPKYGYN